MLAHMITLGAHTTGQSRTIVTYLRPKSCRVNFSSAEHWCYDNLNNKNGGQNQATERMQNNLKHKFINSQAIPKLPSSIIALTLKRHTLFGHFFGEAQFWPPSFFRSGFHQTERWSCTVPWWFLMLGNNRTTSWISVQISAQLIPQWKVVQNIELSQTGQHIQVKIISKLIKITHACSFISISHSNVIQHYNNKYNRVP